MKQKEILKHLSKGAIISHHHQHYDDPEFFRLSHPENDDIGCDLRIDQFYSLKNKGLIKYLMSMNLWNDQYVLSKPQA